jgi:hypothetical protein
LDFGLGQSNVRGAAVDYYADTATVRFTESSDAK